MTHTPRYVGDAISQLKSFVSKYGEDGQSEINTVCTAHVLTLDLDEGRKFNYCGCELSSSGQLVILFAQDYLGTNIYDALQSEHILTMLDEASAASGAINYTSRMNIKAEYDAQIGKIQERLSGILQEKIEVKADFEEISAELAASPGKAPSQWKENIGNFVRFYFEGLANTLESQKFG